VIYAISQVLAIQNLLVTLGWRTIKVLFLFLCVKQQRLVFCVGLASTSLNSMLKVFKMWEKMKVFPMLCFTKLFIVTFCPSDKLLCKILCCDFLSYMFCQNAKFKLWLFVLWLFVRDSLSVTFCPVTFCPTFFFSSYRFFCVVYF
jgi:hypothetical protein